MWIPTIIKRVGQRVVLGERRARPPLVGKRRLIQGRFAGRHDLLKGFALGGGKRRLRLLAQRPRCRAQAQCLGSVAFRAERGGQPLQAPGDEIGGAKRAIEREGFPVAGFRQGVVSLQAGQVAKHSRNASDSPG